MSGNINGETDRHESHLTGRDRVYDHQPSSLAIHNLQRKTGRPSISRGVVFRLRFWYFIFVQFIFLLDHEAIVLSENHDYGNWSSQVFRMESWKLQLKDNTPFPRTRWKIFSSPVSKMRPPATGVAMHNLLVFTLKS